MGNPLDTPIEGAAMTKDQRYYEDKARAYLYPALERAYRQHDKMIATLARAFKRIDELAEEGTI